MREKRTTRKKNPAAVALGRLGGKKRAEKLGKDGLSEQNRKAVQARWSKERNREMLTTQANKYQVQLSEIIELEDKLSDLRRKFLLERDWSVDGIQKWSKGERYFLTDKEAVYAEKND